MAMDSRSPRVRSAKALVDELQRHFVRVLTDTARTAFPHEPDFEARPWDRDDGRHGGGVRFQSVSPTGEPATTSPSGAGAFDRASVNVSLVHYDDEPDRKLAAAVALSAIVHPRPAHAPSIHVHTSFTSLKSGAAYWRIMADLNPSLPDDVDAAAFREALRSAAPVQAQEAFAQGERYFWIPALQRHRGVVHFYLEAFDTGDFDADRQLAERVIRSAIDTYGQILGSRLSLPVDAEARRAQLAYHTVYLFQVLTLDRGTTSGLLVHRDNDVGILGSLPSHVDRDQLLSYGERVPELQRDLVRALASALPEESPAPVTDEVKRDLAAIVRRHYEDHPEALSLQATGNVLPPTVANHAAADDAAE